MMSELKRTDRTEWIVIGILMLVKLVIHQINPEYGYFRDEFFYMAIADQFSFSNLDVPPLTPLYLKLMMTLFGDSLKVLHLASGLAGAFLILIICRMTRELGGNLTAVSLAGFTTLISGQLIFGALFSYDSMDFLIQTASLFVLIKLFKQHEPRLWIILGLLLGLGFLNKLTILFFGLALLVGFLATKQRRYLATRWPWITALIAFVGAIPFVVWQLQNDWYYVGVAQDYSGGIAYAPNIIEYVWSHFFPNNPFTAPIWITGLLALFFVKRYRDFRFFAVAFSFLFILFFIIGAKFYFLIPMFSVLYAAGSVQVVNWIERQAQKQPAWRSARIILPVLMLLFTIPFLPFAMPILPVEKLVPYVAAVGVDAGVRTENTTIANLPQHFADRFGWEEMVEDVADAYQQATDRFGPDVGIITDNWGQAGAIHHFKDEYNLPEPACLQGWYFFQTLLTHEFKDVYVSVGVPIGRMEGQYEQVELVKTYTNQYCMPYENNKLICISSEPRFDIERMVRAESALDEDFAAVLEEEGVTAAIEYYHQRIEQDPIAILFTERQMNTLGYEYLGQDQVEDAIALFELNVEVYPWAFNTYDSLAEAFMVNKQYVLAIEFYQKSLELNPQNTNAEEKLDELATLTGMDI